MVLGLVRNLGLQACSHAAARSSIATRRPLMAAAAAAAAAGERRLLSSKATSTGTPPPPPAASGGAARGQSQLHRGKKAEEKRRLWPYVKAAKQQFFNVVLATLSIVMAVKMVEGKGARVALEEEIAELKRREGVLLRALSNEAWAETVAKRVGAAGGKEAVMLEIGKVVAASMLDKESAELEAMRAAAAKAGQETAAVGEAFDEDPRKNAPSPKATKPGAFSKGML